jgi:hypothetical protein
LSEPFAYWRNAFHTPSDNRHAFANVAANLPSDRVHVDGDVIPGLAALKLVREELADCTVNLRSGSLCGAHECEGVIGFETFALRFAPAGSAISSERHNSRRPITGTRSAGTRTRQ